MKANKNKYLYFSAALHAAVLFALIFSFNMSQPVPVIENTLKHDVISAVVLGDTSKSKLLPEPAIRPRDQMQSVKAPEKIIPVQQSKPKPEEASEKKAIALRIEKNKKLLIKKKKLEEDRLARAKKKANEKKLLAEMRLEAKKNRKTFESAFLEDLKRVKKENVEQKMSANKKLKMRFDHMLKEQAEASLRQDLLAEEVKLQGAQSRQSQGEVNKYKALILQAISENWIVPVHANKKLYCELMIRVAPGGMVLDVRVMKTSGDASLDRSARAAVLKSSPLPVPPKNAEFESFRQFVLKVKPENIIRTS